MGRHVIDRLSFEVDFAAEADAVAQQEVLGSFANERGLAVIQEVFDEFSGPEEIVRLDRLEVDLGEVDFLADPAAAAARLREAVREALQAALSGRTAPDFAGPDLAGPDLAGSDLAGSDLAGSHLAGLASRAVAGSSLVSPAPQRFDVPTAELDLVWTQLEAGHLPWTAAILSADDFDALVWRVADGQAEALATRLRGSPRVADLLARLVRQWPERARGVFAARLAARLATRLAATPGVGASPEAAELAAAATGSGGPVTAQVDAFLRLLAPAAASGEASGAGGRADPPSATPGVAPLTPQGGDAERADGPATRRDEPRPGDRRQADARAVPGLRGLDPSVRRELERQLLAGRLEDDLRRVLLAQAPAWLAERLRHHGRAAAWRRRMAETLDAPGLEALVGLWAAPADAALLASLATQVSAWPPHPRETAETVGRHLRAALLAEVLLAETALDLAAIVAGLVQRFADVADLAPAQVAARLAQAWPDHGPGRRHRPQIVALVSAAPAPRGPAPQEPQEISVLDAAAAATADAPPDAEVVPDQPADRLRTPPTVGAPSQAGEADPEGATPLRRRLLQALDAAAPSRLAAAVSEALAEDAAWLRRVLVARGAEPRTVRALVEALDPPRLFALVEPGLSEADVRFLLAATPPADAGLPVARAFWSEVVAAGLSGPPGALAQRLMRRPGAETDARLQRAWAFAERGDAAALGGRRGSPTGAPGRSVEQGAVVADEPAFASSLPSSPMSEPDGPDAKRPAAEALDHPLALDRLLEQLPQRPRAATAHALSPLLAPTELGLARLAPLAEAQRRDLFLRLRPVDGIRALEAVDRLAQASRRAALAEPAEGWAMRRWRVLLLELVEEGRRFDPGRLARRWAEATSGDDRAAVRATLHAALGRGAGDGRPRVAGGAPPPTSGGSDPGRSDHELMAAALGPDPARGEAEATEPLQPLAPTTWGFGEPDAGATLYVANAGAVLVGPYLPALFGRLGLLTEGRFTDVEAAERAVHLLQFAVDGGGPAPEHLLSLNKLLCGLDLATPIGRDFAILDAERATIEGLLSTLIQRWSILGRTSIAGLRESFLQREGALAAEDDGWRLTVAPRAFDMLLDQIPWGYGTQRLPWMKGVLHVEWR